MPKNIFFIPNTELLPLDFIHLQRKKKKKIFSSLTSNFTNLELSRNIVEILQENQNGTNQELFPFYMKECMLRKKKFSKV